METKETEIAYLERSNNKQQFDKRLIAHVVELAEQGVPRKSLIQEYGMSPSTLKDWIQRYSSKVAKRKQYTQAEKRSVVRAIASGMSIKQAQITFDISYPSLIRGWMNEFKENDELGASKPIEVTQKPSDIPENLEFQALKKALSEANLKVKALNTMIDIAEEQLKIDIRKKSGARQSSK